jgi:hypothetical protein
MRAEMRAASYANSVRPLNSSGRVSVFIPFPEKVREGKSTYKGKQ